MENNTFVYQYSAETNKEVESIRTRYMPREGNKMEQLKSLDRKVRSAGMMTSLCIGIIGVLVFGLGMCFGLGALSAPNWLAVLLGVLGALIMIPAYPVYKRIARKTKEQLTPEILRLSDELMKSK